MKWQFLLNYHIFWCPKVCFKPKRTKFKILLLITLLSSVHCTQAIQFPVTIMWGWLYWLHFLLFEYLKCGSWFKLLIQKQINLYHFLNKFYFTVKSKRKNSHTPLSKKKVFEMALKCICPCCIKLTNFHVFSKVRSKEFLLTLVVCSLP